MEPGVAIAGLMLCLLVNVFVFMRVANRINSSLLYWSLFASTQITIVCLYFLWPMSLILLAATFVGFSYARFVKS